MSRDMSREDMLRRSSRDISAGYLVYFPRTAWAVIYILINTHYN